MRMDQYVGLTERAHKWLQEHAALRYTETLSVSTVNGVETHRSSATNVAPCSVDYDYIEGAWDDHVAPLRRYQLQDGREVEEFVQAEPWSSGPMYFVGLRWVGKEPRDEAEAAALYALNWTPAEISEESR